MLPALSAACRMVGPTVAATVAAPAAFKNSRRVRSEEHLGWELLAVMETASLVGFFGMTFAGEIAPSYPEKTPWLKCGARPRRTRSACAEPWG